MSLLWRKVHVWSSDNVLWKVVQDLNPGQFKFQGTNLLQAPWEFPVTLRTEFELTADGNGCIREATLERVVRSTPEGDNLDNAIQVLAEKRYKSEVPFQIFSGAQVSMKDNFTFWNRYIVQVGDFMSCCRKGDLARSERHQELDLKRDRPSKNTYGLPCTCGESSERLDLG